MTVQFREFQLPRQAVKDIEEYRHSSCASQFLSCLKIVAASYPAEIPIQGLAELEAALTVLETYEMMDDALEEGNRLAGKEDPEEGTLPCSGTAMLLIFCVLAVCMRTLSEEKR